MITEWLACGLTPKEKKIGQRKSAKKKIEEMIKKSFIQRMKGEKTCLSILKR